MADQIKFVPFAVDEPEILMGFNSETGEFVGTCLEAGPVGENPVANGMTGGMTAQIINSHEQLTEALGVNVEAAGRYGMASGSAKFNYSQASTFNTTSTFVVAQCRYENAIRRARDFRVPVGSQAERLLTANRMDEFRTAFGDSFVRGIKTGGEFFAVMRITTESSTSQMKLGASLAAEVNGLVAAGSFKAEFNMSKEQSGGRSEFFASCYQSGGDAEQITPTLSLDEILDRVRSFPKIVKEHPVGYLAEVASYDTIPIPVPTYEESESLVMALRDANSKRLSYLTRKNDFEFAKENPEFFVDLPARDKLDAAIAAYTDALNRVTQHAIRLSQGQIKGDQQAMFFDASTINLPEGIDLKRIENNRNNVLPSIPVPNVVGKSYGELENAQRWASVGVRTAEATYSEDGQGGVDQVLLDLANSEITIAVDPPEASSFDRWVCVAQFPGAGALLRSGEKLILQYQLQPI
jgi:hypothetical protein